ncbi:MAG: hypothetical protein K2L80_08935 [Muribaculaceae bacterium]|nr:hypothetical protein [Muribaculaceae bacterium]MDE6332714.1 hypothetical protein [Muribaculaceae bacterium]
MTAKDSKIYNLEVLFPQTGEESRMLLGCRRDEFSASRIAHAVEDCNAHLINLNVLGMEHPDTDTLVDIRISRRNTAEVARSLARYGYEVLEAEGFDVGDGEADVLRERIDELLHYLDI